MRTRGLLTGAAQFAGHLIRHPVKTTLNTIEGIKTGPDFPDNKIITGLAGAGGLAAAFVGAINRDPLLTGIGLTFASVAGGIYEQSGARIRAETHAARAAEEVLSEKPAPAAENPASETAKAQEAEPEPAKMEDLITPAAKPVFKPNLPRPKGAEGGP